jgi:hypothetical protein
MPNLDLKVDPKAAADELPEGAHSSAMISLLIIAGAFVCSRLLFYQQGIRFDASTITYAWQFLDPELLRRDLLSSVFHLHTQPPLFNLFLGVVIKSCGAHSGFCFAAIYSIMGLVICFSLFAISRRLGTPNGLSVALALLFMVSPPSILYENWLFYTYPLVMLLCLAVVALQRFLRLRSYASCLAFFAVLAAIVLLRSGFHLGWFLLISIILVACLKNCRRQVLICCLIPLCLCGSWYLKNLLLFGSFTSSSLLGMNLARMTIIRVWPAELASLAEQGYVSPMALVGTFRKVEDYKPYLSNVEKTHVPALDRELKSTGAENFNHLSYLQISRRLLEDSISIILLKPGEYAATVQESLGCFFKPANDYGILDRNRRQIHEIEHFYNRVACCQLGDEGIGLTILALFLVALVGGGWMVGKGLLAKSPDLEVSMPIAFMWITMLYVTVVFNCCEIYENQRFRFLIEPYVLVIVGTLLGRLPLRKPPMVSIGSESETSACIR